VLRQLSTSGKKAELILRMQAADPTRAWMEEAARHCDNVEDREEKVHMILPNVSPLTRGESSTPSENDIQWKKVDLLTRERDLMCREIELKTRE